MTKNVKLDANGINNQEVSYMVDVLNAKKNTIKEFSVKDCHVITAAGWATLSHALSAAIPNLTKLCFGGENFGDDAAIELVHGMCKNSSVKVLHLSHGCLTNFEWKMCPKPTGLQLSKLAGKCDQCPLLLLLKIGHRCS